jgi:hypothetical protein
MVSNRKRAQLDRVRSNAAGPHDSRRPQLDEDEATTDQWINSADEEAWCGQAVERSPRSR